MFIKRFFYKILLSFRKLRGAYYKPEKIRVKIDIPYYSQFASEKIVKNFISGSSDLRNDPKWKESGAKTKEEYVIWAWNGCGMACLKMVLASRDLKQNSLVELGKKCFKYGGYVVNSDAKINNDFRNYYDGLFYAPFLKFIKKEFGVEGRIVSPMTKTDIIRALDYDQFVIASVNPQIREPNTPPLTKRGHLVLVVGYDFDSKMFYLHNPSGYYGVSQKYAEISFRNFERFFTHKGVVLDA
jgi:uncharacterized protein YvpB